MTISKPKVCVISDLHLGVHTNSAVWHKIALDWAEWLVSELKAKKIKDIIFCGDWHHNRSEISVSTLQISADVLNIFKDFNIIAVTGNHDLYYKHRTDVNSLSIYKGRKNITVIDTVTTSVLFDRKITFCPWNTPVDEIPESNTIFGHFEIETFNMNGMKICEEGFKVKDLMAKSELVISGHFHTRHEKHYKNGTILYCGNPFQMDFGDCGNSKGYYILDIDTNDYTFYENTISPKYIRIFLSELIAYKSITPEVEAVFNNNIVKVKVDREVVREDIDFLYKEFLKLGPLNLTFDHDTVSGKDERHDADLSGIDIPEAIEEFVNLLEIEDKRDIIDYTLDLFKRCNV